MINPVRIAVISDIHGNLTALDAVLADLESRRPDLVLHGGDLALGGCRPAEAIDRIRELGSRGVVGNADELLWRPELQAVQARRAPKLAPLLSQLFEEYAPVTRRMIGRARLEWLRALPNERREGGLVLLHASPDDLWRAPLPDADDDELLSTYRSYGAALVVYGHIHRPYVRRVGEQLVIANSGSVGSPYDGDPRASYLLIDDGVAQIVRVDYDLERETSLLLSSEYPDAARLAESRRRGEFVALA
jgi:putative phosphoesterase